MGRALPPRAFALAPIGATWDGRCRYRFRPRACACQPCELVPIESCRHVWHNQAIPYEADFSLNGNTRELERIVAETSRFCRENSLDENAEFQLNLVLEELFVNTVRHGGCEGVENSARVRLLAAADGVEVEFADRGRPFDPTAAPPVDTHATLEERRGSGLGIHLVRQIMRDLRYRRTGEWNQITMKRPAAQAATGEQPMS